MAKKPPIAIPTLLSEAVKTKRAVLFLGAGASKEAKNAAGQNPPDANQLRDILAREFFRREMKTRDVMAVAEMAIASGVGAPRVYEAVRQVFDPFQPSVAHRLVATFSWRMIATTNYDLLVERAYADNSSRVQNLVRFVKDDEPIEEKLQSTLNPVQYLKLHGCLEHIHDPDIPMVLSREQYATYSQSRTHLFSRLHWLARESSVIFVGYRLDDNHIRDLIYKLSSDSRPRWYIVTPDADDLDVAFWGTRNVEVITCRFGEFMAGLDAAIPAPWRALPQSDKVVDFPIRKFYVTVTEESAAVRASVGSDLTLVHSQMAYEDQTAKLFYEGYDTGWGGIINRFDVRRRVEDEIIFKAILEPENPTGPLLFMLHGAAGSGKTIALKRTAFEAATSSDALVLWLEEGGALRPDVFLELYDLTNRPIYLFVDQVALQKDKLYALLRVARFRRVPLIVIGAEREADWNTYCQTLDSEFVPKAFRLGNLSRQEVEVLLDLLERHDCLGLLREKTREQQIAEFMEKERADRQLLVALHELTQGKPFEEIIFQEHQRIHPERARQLYLDIATMHQFGIKVRAGIISRISGIEFRDFEEHFFNPLKEIVKVEEELYSQDYAYRTRHARVAQLVFRQACPDDEMKARQFKRILESLDPGYSADSRALDEITRGRVLLKTFNGVVEARELYEMAVQIAPKQGYLYQQWAIFELHHPGGSTKAAEEFAARARELDPSRISIIHTQVEVDRKRANDEQSPILKESLRRRARERLNDMPSNDRLATSSRCKLLVDEVSDLKASLPAELKPYEAFAFADKVKDTEAVLLKAQQMFPEEADILEVEARFRRELDEDDKALFALERALAAGPKGSGTAIRLARVYDARGHYDKALKVLQDTLAANPDDKPIHQAIALHYLSLQTFQNSLVENHLKKSFTLDDQNFEARYILAQFLFYKGDVADAVGLFDLINNRAPESFRKNVPFKDTLITVRLPGFSGSVESMKDRFLFIRSGAYPKSIFAHHSFIIPEVLDELSIGQEVSFRIRFNRAGPTAVDLAPKRYVDGRERGLAKAEA